MENKNETIKCKKCQQDFLLDQDDFSFYEKMDVPLPKICPDCRFKLCAIWRNEISLYSGRKCGLCKKNVISMYNPKSGYNTFCHKCFLSDSWDPRNFAINYDKSVPFFEQFNNLLLNTPKDTTFISSGSGPCINSEYSNMAGGMKNCYFVFNGGIGEEMLYCRGVRNAKEISDCYFGEYLERCYECINILKSNGLIYARNTFDSMDSMFVLNCSGLNNCFGCVNLKNKSYHFFNELLSREEYKKKISEIIGSYSKMEEFKKKFDEFSLKFPRRENNNLKTQNSIGDFLLECKNVQNSFEIISAEHSKNLFSTRSANNSSDAVGYGYKSELLLGCVGVGHSSNIIGSHSVDDSQDILYSFALRNCHDCIGCDGLKNASYCILNKQYKKEEYEKLKEYIINELKKKELFGLMIPLELAPFAYNETIAQDNMPLTKNEALAQGFRWEDNIQKTEGKETIKPENIPDHIKDVPDSITNEILCCIDCNRNYKITAQELIFYRKMILPIPRKCFYCRHKDRIIRRGPYKFWKRNCDKCQKEITTNYAPDRPEIVYCESCYQKEVY
ncbi:MAG: hypothetical protein WC822_03925 [Candidatus Paceibacterota bacterium]|jgi:hypothetical protein